MSDDESAQSVEKGYSKYPRMEMRLIADIEAATGMTMDRLRDTSQDQNQVPGEEGEQRLRESGFEGLDHSLLGCGLPQTPRPRFTGHQPRGRRQKGAAAANMVRALTVKRVLQLFSGLSRCVDDVKTGIRPRV